MADPRLTVSPKELAILTSSGVPAISLLDACRGCDEDEDEYDIDSDEPDQVGRSRTNTGKAAAAATASTASTDSAPAQSGFLSRLGRVRVLVCAIFVFVLVFVQTLLDYAVAAVAFQQPLGYK